jgi:HEAT repeat protein
MFPGKRLWPLMISVAVGLGGLSSVNPAEIPDEDAWNALPKYEPGQDMSPLLVIDRAVIKAMASPKLRSTCAARLASMLADADTTPAARQYICLQLRQIGTLAEVPLLAKLLAKPETSEIARYALQTIPGPEADFALREALTTLDGRPLVGVIHSVAARKDTAAVPTLQRLADSPDKEIASAAIWALGNVADDQAFAFLTSRAGKAGTPLPQGLAVPLLRSADIHVKAGKDDEARTIYRMLSQAGQPVGARRAALEATLRLGGKETTATILAWLSDPDADRRRIATGHLHTLSNQQLDRLLAQLPDLPDPSKLAVMELAALRRGQQLLPTVRSLMASDQPELKLAGVRWVGMVGDTSVIPQLVALLAEGSELTKAAQDALVKLPRKEVTAALLDALHRRPAIRVPVIDLLVKLKCYDAIDPLIDIASQTDPDLYAPALDGLGGIADPDQTDIRRLVQLLLRTEPGRHRDEVERTILIVCNKLPANVDRSELVRIALARADRPEKTKYLPLLGRLGGAKSLETIESALTSTDPGVQEAAVRALCNWPNAKVADKLLELATKSENRAFRVWALRAYIRVVTLPNDRPETETLAMLQHATKLADGLDEKRLAIQRASAIRLMETVTWIASYLDDPQLCQPACKALVELAHHRFLRHPNIDRFDPILEKVSRVANDPSVAERARRYRLGL